mmetsp:Transcript_44674/g.105066  ORF Transcript_44674/g.105066 Transcript_44674/m.105066 type:complete len:221 (-) Transcript_44674:242-904(-)
MPWATPTLKGFRKAVAKPTCEPTNGIATPVSESSRSASASGMKISTKGIASSAMPKLAPPSENSVTKPGMTAARTRAERLCARATALIIASMASVFCSTAKAPPTISTKPMISPASTKPLIGAVRKAASPCGRDSAAWKLPAMMSFLPLTSSVSNWPPGTTQVASAISASRLNSRTKVLGSLRVIGTAVCRCGRPSDPRFSSGACPAWRSGGRCVQNSGR